MTEDRAEPEGRLGKKEREWVEFRISAVFGGPGLAIGKLLRYDVRNSGGEGFRKKSMGRIGDTMRMKSAEIRAFTFTARFYAGLFFVPFYYQEDSSIRS